MSSSESDFSDGEDGSSDGEYAELPPHDKYKCSDDMCAICLNDFGEQQIGVPESCSHVFCIDCVLQWSKVSCSCPADRIEFSCINVYQKFGGSFCKKVIVKKTLPLAEEEEGLMICEICNSGENEDTLLLCDGCDQGYHCECISPPLAQVPTEEWFCRRCRPRQLAARSNRASVNANQRTVGRTRATERVRNQISISRVQHATASSLNEQLDAIINNILENSARFQVVSSPRERPTEARGRTTKKRRTARGKGKKRKTRRKKTRSRSRKQKKGDSGPYTSGLSSKSAAISSTAINGQPLSMMGTTDQLDEYYAQDIDETMPSYKIAQHHRKLTQSALIFNTPLPSLFTGGIKKKKVKREKTPPPVPDLLGSILGGQELLLKPASEIQIQKGGKLGIIKKKKWH